MKIINIDDKGMEKLRGIIEDKLMEFYESKYEGNQNEEPATINQRFELHGYSGFDGKSEDEHYDMHYLKITMKTEELEIKHEMSVQEFASEFAYGLKKSFETDAPFWKESGNELVFDLSEYTMVSVIKFEDITKIINETQVKVEQLLLDMGVKKADMKMEFQAIKMWY